MEGGFGEIIPENIVKSTHQRFVKSPFRLAPSPRGTRQATPNITDRSQALKSKYKKETGVEAIAAVAVAFRQVLPTSWPGAFLPCLPSLPRFSWPRISVPPHTPFAPSSSPPPRATWPWAVRLLRGHLGTTCPSSLPHGPTARFQPHSNGECSLDSVDRKTRRSSTMPRASWSNSISILAKSKLALHQQECRHVGKETRDHTSERHIDAFCPSLFLNGRLVAHVVLSCLLLFCGLYLLVPGTANRNLTIFMTIPTIHTRTKQHNRRPPPDSKSQPDADRHIRHQTTAQPHSTGTRKAESAANC